MFAKTQAVSGMPAKSAKGVPGLSIIGPEVIISGDLATDAQIHVDGRIDGNVHCASLCQGPAGIIAGNIIADEARLCGTVEGTVSARNIVVEASARIMGDIAYETISIEAGAAIEGRLARRAALAQSGEETLTVTPVSFSPAKAEADARGLFQQS
jgi:cytoskeletal protein CcmA (bactofilin family)